MGRRLAVLAALVLFATAAHAQEVAVVDGDTLKLGEETIRLFGIDAPEAGQKCREAGGGTWPCGTQATARLKELTRPGIECDGQGRDDYGRLLAVCYADGVDISRQMIAEGLAWSFRRYADSYNADEDDARLRGVGIWQVETETPWALRESRWNAAAQEAPEGCPIKGNINRQGERIYHAPWSPWYSRTVVNEKQGERWFCDEGEALAAGWRAPLWGG